MFWIYFFKLLENEHTYSFFLHFWLVFYLPKWLTFSHSFATRIYTHRRTEWNFNSITSVTNGSSLKKVFVLKQGSVEDDGAEVCVHTFVIMLSRVVLLVRPYHSADDIPFSIGVSWFVSSYNVARVSMSLYHSLPVRTTCSKN